MITSFITPSRNRAGDLNHHRRMTTEIIIAPSPDLRPAPLFTPTPKAAKRVLEFFTAQINNDHTRRAYLNATRRFAAWCAQKNIDELSRVQPFHVAAFVKDLQDDLSPPSIKQHLAGLRMLFDWLVTGHIIDVNPAHAVRGPKYVVKKGKTPVLTADEARALLDSIPIVKPAEEGSAKTQPDLLGLRDRALIGIMAYSFARVGAVTKMKVGDYFVQGRRRLVRLHEKGGKEHDVPCHHNLDHFLDEYIEAAGIADDVDGYLFRTAAGKTGLLSDKPLYQQDAYRMIQRRAKAAGIETRIGNHTFRATGITAYLKNSGKLEVAQHIASHESPRTTKLYDRRQDEISLDEIERIAI
jgi:site-specific recombinase XerD